MVPGSDAMLINASITATCRLFRVLYLLDILNATVMYLVPVIYEVFIRLS